MGSGKYQAFGLPSFDPQDEIEFRFANGWAPRGFRYADLDMVFLLPPGNVLLLRFRGEAGGDVDVIGQNLAIVCEYIKANRIGWVAEAASWDFDDVKATVVWNIAVRDVVASIT
jgi:hypothetical protein